MQKYKEAILYLIVIVIIFVFAATKTVPKIMELTNTYKTIEAKKLEATDLQTKLDELIKYETQKAESVVELKKIYKQDSPDLAPEDAFTTVFEDIINMSKYNDVKVFSINYTYNPTDDEFVMQSANNYNVCQLDMELVADYKNFGSFMQELFKYPYLINIDNIEMIAYPKNKKILLIKLKLKLYTKKQAQDLPSAPAPAVTPGTTPQGAATNPMAGPVAPMTQ